MKRLALVLVLSLTILAIGAPVPAQGFQMRFGGVGGHGFAGGRRGGAGLPPLTSPARGRRGRGKASRGGGGGGGGFVGGGGRSGGGMGSARGWPPPFVRPPFFHGRRFDRFAFVVPVPVGFY